jgi:hypothetical protein
MNCCRPNSKQTKKMKSEKNKHSLTKRQEERLAKITAIKILFAVVQAINIWKKNIKS